jgi:Cof subfamily protein (haloacid dehalogenase superfamily)
MQIRMVGVDLDGTLLNSRKELTAYTKRVITEAIERGVIVLAATGRPYIGVPEELMTLPGMRYALTSNGARILDTKTGETLVEHLLSQENAKKALEIFQKYDTLQEVYYDGQGYAEKDKLAHIERYHKNPNMWEYVRTSRKAVDDIRDVMRRENRSMDKVQALFAKMDERAKAWEELKQFQELALVGSLGYNIEVNSRGVNKGRGLLELGKLLGIRREEIMSVGDGDNDIAMLEESGLGVAMGNADSEVKQAADYITDTNDEDGAAKAIVRFVLEGGER